MQNYVISLFYVSIFVIFFSFLLPKGKLSKEVKNIFSILIIVSVVIPLLNTFRSIENFNLDSGIQINYLEGITTLKYDKIKEGCIKELNKDSKICNDIEVQYSFDKNYSVFVDKVNVILNKSELKDDKEHKYIIEKIKSSIVIYYNVKESDINVYEK